MRYSLVATTISVIDAGGLYLLHEGWAVNVYVARVLSYFAAMTTGYFLNRRFTFHNHTRVHGFLTELAHYYGVHATGGLINYGLFSLVLVIGHALVLPDGWLFWVPLFGVWVGGVAGMCFNYTLSHRLIFRRRQS